MARKNQSHRRQQRREEAFERNKEWQGLTDKEKLDSLIKRGHGHCKQAERLHVKIYTRKK